MSDPALPSAGMALKASVLPSGDHAAGLPVGMTSWRIACAWTAGRDVIWEAPGTALAGTAGLEVPASVEAAGSPAPAPVAPEAGGDGVFAADGRADACRLRG